ncbi:hypothetical protein EJD97_020078 [Solanum chilense]|uniref:Uncharacterized protein n=1 Tax=Solanum chilense TaxID=4083 RepID=A0A6N2AH58_SOLCI|nr:hypothetical protein EJD97_020078 [Solanum chilense]
MDDQSPSKRFTRGIPLHVQIDVENPPFSLGLTKENLEKFHVHCLNLLTCNRSKFNNDPLSFVDGGMKNTVDVVTKSNKKRKPKTDVHTFHNDKNEAVGYGSIEYKVCV